MERVLDKPETDAVEVFNIGTGKGLSTLEVVQGFEKATGVKVNWEYAPRREGDIEQVWGNVDKANKVLGWKAETPTEEVLKSAWKWQEKLRKDGIQ
jgi:UDP-glucose 4-epimerase